MIALLQSFLSEEQALLITLMLASIPLSYVLARLRNKHMLLAYSIVASVYLQSVMFPA